jgi:hypothetical protein
MKLENRSWREIQNIANDIICQYARESIIHKKEGVDMSDLIIQTLNALNAASLDKPSSPRASSEK